MPARTPCLAALALLLLAGCGGDEPAADGAATGAPAAASAPADTGLNSSVTVDTQASPVDTAEHVH